MVKRVNNEILLTTRNEKPLPLIESSLQKMILQGLTKDIAIFTVHVYKFISGSGNMVFRKIEKKDL